MAPESPFEQAAGEKRWELWCTSHAVEPLTELMAYLFAAYFREKSGAVIDDPQTGRWFTEPEAIKAEVESVRREMLAQYREWGVYFMPFRRWSKAE